MAFEPHNMLELVLFYGIPYKDTNPIAHNLINAFGGIENAIRAPKSEQIKISGVGEHASDFLHFFDFASSVAVYQYMTEAHTKPQYKTSSELGNLLVEKCNEGMTGLHLVMLNNRFEIVDIVPMLSGETPVYNIDRKLLIEEIIKTNSSLAILVQFKPGGVAFPRSEDIMAIYDLKNELLTSGTFLAEFFIVTEKDFTPVIRSSRIFKGTKKFFADDEGEDVFMLSANDGLDAAATQAKVEKIQAEEFNGESFDSERILCRLLSFCMKKGSDELSSALAKRYGSLYRVLSADKNELYDLGVNDVTYTLLRLTLIIKKYLAKKNLAQGLTMDAEDKILLLFSMSFFADEQEKFSFMFFDGTKRFIEMRELSAGVINTVAIQSRTAMESMISRKAKYVILAHNHPNCSPQPSTLDLKTTEKMCYAFENAGIKLLSHYIISRDKYTSVPV